MTVPLSAARPGTPLCFVGPFSPFATLDERLPYMRLITSQPVGTTCPLNILRKGEEMKVRCSNILATSPSTYCYARFRSNARSNPRNISFPSSTRSTACRATVRFTMPTQSMIIQQIPLLSPLSDRWRSRFHAAHASLVRLSLFIVFMTKFLSLDFNPHLDVGTLSLFARRRVTVSA